MRPLRITSRRRNRRAKVERLAEAVRGHWGIENSLHWVLDVTLREDDSRLRTGYGAENFAVIRHIALNLLKREPSKNSLKRKRYKAALSNEFRTFSIRRGVQGLGAARC